MRPLPLLLLPALQLCTAEAGGDDPYSQATAPGWKTASQKPNATIAAAAATPGTGQADAAGGPAAKAWKQDRFVISMCNDPIVTPDQFAYRYQEMAEANFVSTPHKKSLTGLVL